ncbi:hypothetical protein V8G54_035855 [Vigna mungo]|uniref:Uncharacterized protein n=1 Tax=Vigna mungo TaxID=3915 RepID=A0AAQ3RDR2_VIGMU
MIYLSSRRNNWKTRPKRWDDLMFLISNNQRLIFTSPSLEGRDLNRGNAKELAKKGKSLGIRRECSTFLLNLEGPLIRMRKGVSLYLVNHELKVINESDPKILFQGFIDLSSRRNPVRKNKMLGLMRRRNLAKRRNCLRGLTPEAEKKLKELNITLTKSFKKEKATTEKVHELYDYVFNEHKRGFQKDFRQAEFLYEEVWITDYQSDARFTEITSLKKAAKEAANEGARGREEASKRDIDEGSGEEVMLSSSTYVEVVDEENKVERLISVGSRWRTVWKVRPKPVTNRWKTTWKVQPGPIGNRCGTV